MSKKAGSKPMIAHFTYIKPENYEPTYVNGVYGGITPRGELLCHFFFEYSDIPAEEQFPVSDDGRIDTKESKQVPRDSRDSSEVTFRRDVKVGVIIPLQHVSSIMAWMQDKLDFVKKESKPSEK